MDCNVISHINCVDRGIMGHVSQIYCTYNWEFRIALAAFLGAFVGLERELRGKAAGIRTYAIISMASCLFTILSKNIGGDHDPARIAANIVTGVGFLGAGVIWHKDSGVEGLTTAASIWCVSALGMAIGFNYISIAVSSGASVLVIMEIFGLIQRKLFKIFGKNTNK